MYKLPVETVNKVLEYLNQRPFGEVADLIVALRKGELEEEPQKDNKKK